MIQKYPKLTLKRKDLNMANQFKKMAEAKKKYEDCCIRFSLKKEQMWKKQNELHMETIKKALEDVGIVLNVSEDQVSLRVNPYVYAQKNNRFAGPRTKLVYGKSGDRHIFYSYSDIVYMMETQSDKEIIEQLNISHATFYRHKKVLLNSTYYKSLDPKRKGDLSYLENIPGNLSF